MGTERDAIQARTRSDGLRLLRTINDTQAHVQGGQGLTRPGRHRKQDWRSAPSVTKMPWPTS